MDEGKGRVHTCVWRVCVRLFGWPGVMGGTICVPAPVDDLQVGPIDKYAHTHTHTHRQHIQDSVFSHHVAAILSCAGLS